MNRSFYELLTNTELKNTRMEAVSACEAMMKISGPSTEMQSYIAIVYHYEAQQLLSRGQDPTAAIAAGLTAIAGCVGPPEPDPYCLDVQALSLIHICSGHRPHTARPFVSTRT